MMNCFQIDGTFNEQNSIWGHSLNEWQEAEVAEKKIKLYFEYVSRRFCVRFLISLSPYIGRSKSWMEAELGNFDL